MFASITTALLLLALPALAIALSRRISVFRLLGPVVLCYLFGGLLASFAGKLVDGSTAQQLRDIALPLALPLMLFPMDVKAWWRNAWPSVVSFGLAILSVGLISLAGWFLFARSQTNGVEMSAMLAGMYSGGTPNMAVIHQALSAPPELFLQLHAADVLLGALLFLFLISFAKPIFSLLLGASPSTAANSENNSGSPAQSITGESTTDTGVPWCAGLIAVLLSALIVGAAIGSSMAILGKIAVPLVMLVITSLAVLASLKPAIRELAPSYSMGFYLVLVFCVALGSEMHIDSILADASPKLLLVGFVMYGSLLLHLLLARLFRVDVDTFLVTNTAALFGPPFVPAVVNAIGNRALLLSGLTCGLLGYAAGNYLGLSLAWLLGNL